MERTKGMKSGLKALAVGLVLVAAMASTGCGQNALLNPTADQVAAGQDGGSSLAKSTTTVDSGGQIANPGGQLSHP
ncbi:MAG TPA: hypothetical protein VF363_10835 [Candidatus Eisenbacteria bacterium]